MRRLTELGHEPVDHGPAEYDALDDYPTYCLRAAEATAAEPDSLGVVIGGSGNGEAISANKVTGIRCALAWSTEIAQLAREHNDANIVSLGARMHDEATALSILETFLDTAFTGDERHSKRIAMMSDYERTGTLPPV